MTGRTGKNPNYRLPYVDRCPMCGAWRWCRKCSTPHTDLAVFRSRRPA